MDISALLTQYGDKYLQALLTTWKLTVFSFAIAFLIGILITVIRVCPIRPLQLFGDFYVQIFRNIPGAALLILLVYALPYLNIILSYYTCVLIRPRLPHQHACRRRCYCLFNLCCFVLCNCRRHRTDRCQN